MATREAWLGLLLTWALLWEIASKKLKKFCHKVSHLVLVGGRVEEYSGAEVDGIREDWSTYAAISIVK
ncbi:hypothetical protein Hanom_Chr09g00847901 [Helianthus anomalus]